MNYTDKQMKDHEMNFWIKDFKKPFFHEKFYKDFFNFDFLKNKKVLDVGCGGSPVSEYTNQNFDLTIVDPLINDLLLDEKYKHLAKFKNFSKSILEFNDFNYDVVVCLNVIDHFNDKNCTFIDKFNSLLKDDGELWLYYDIRPVDCENHLALDNDLIISKIKKMALK